MSIPKSLIVVCLLLSETEVNAQTEVWGRSLGGAGTDQGSAIAVDPAGNLLVTGYFHSVVELGGWRFTSAGDADIFIVKYDSTGKYLWSQSFGDGRSDHGSAIAVDPAGNILVTGYFHGTVDFGGGPLESAGRSDVFIASYDSTGAHLWSQARGGAGPDVGLGIAVDSSGAVFVTGWFTDTADMGDSLQTSAGDADMFIIAYDADGEPLWSRRAGGTGPDAGAGITTDNEGNVIVTGHFSEVIDFGTGEHRTSGSSDIFVVKFDAEGIPIWSRASGSSGMDDGWGVAASHEGEVIVTGSFQGTVDFGNGPLLSAGRSDLFVTKYDAAGATLWSRRAGAADDDDGWGIATDPRGNILVTGRINGTVDFGSGPITTRHDADVFVAAYDSAGTPQSSARFADTDRSQGLGIAVARSGSIALTGDFEGSLDFGDGLLMTGGESDVFIARFNAPPVTLIPTTPKRTRAGFTLFVSFGLGAQENQMVDDSASDLIGPNIGIGAFADDDFALMARFAFTQVQLENNSGRKFSSTSFFLGPSFQGWLGDRLNLELGFGVGWVDTGERSCTGGFLFPRSCSDVKETGESLLLGGGYSLVLTDGLSIQVGVQYFAVFVNGTHHNLSLNLGFQVL